MPHCPTSGNLDENNSAKILCLLYTSFLGVICSFGFNPIKSQSNICSLHFLTRSAFLQGKHRAWIHLASPCPAYISHFTFPTPATPQVPTSPMIYSVLFNASEPAEGMHAPLSPSGLVAISCGHMPTFFFHRRSQFLPPLQRFPQPQKMFKFLRQ